MIEKVAIIGMGALGLLFGERIQEALGYDSLCFLMDEGRCTKGRESVYRINGVEKDFAIYSPKDIPWKPDLIIVSTKYSGLLEARTMALDVAKSETILISLLNGISSEEILAEKYPRERIIDCVALGMDAVRMGTDLEYVNPGMLRIGITDEVQRDYLNLLQEFLVKTGINYQVSPDIKTTMWSKLMMNVGINQTCMVYETNYGGALSPGPARDDLEKAMHEVIDVAHAEGIELTEEEFRRNIEIFESLSKEGCPSMRQDAMAKRKSEVELFAGTIIRLAKSRGVKVPVNEKYYKKILAMEADY